MTLSPTIQFPPNTQNASRLVLMVDLDAPMGSANRSLSPLLHWLQSSISPEMNEIPSNYSNNPESFYYPPSPPPGSDPHRYVVLAFNQPSATFTMPTGFTQFNATYRFVFDVQGFADAAMLGSPIGAYYILAQNTTSPAVYTGSSSQLHSLQNLWVVPFVLGLGLYLWN